jgi:hypothetical protein
MQLCPDAINDFKAIYRDEFGVDLSDDEATEKARQLLQFFETVAHALRQASERHRAPDGKS